MDISIIIVNYRGWNALDECLESIDSIVQETFSFETIIVDNYSNDGQFPIFKKKYPKLTFIENIGNNGFSNGCNFGTTIAKGNHFLFLNPDTKITLAALQTLLKTAISNPDIGILSCLQVNENNAFYKQTNSFPSLWNFSGISRFIFKSFNKAKLQKRFNNNIKNTLFYPDWVTGAVIFISREWFNKINGWNEDFWLYYEDVDLCKKVSLNKGKVAVTREAIIFHKHGGASRLNIKTKALTKTEVIISRHVYINNHFSKILKILLHILLCTGVFIEKIFLSFLSLFLFFIPNLKVNQLILKKLTIYYFNAILNQTWISPRSMNYKKN